MKKLIVDFRTNYANSDYNSRLMYKCNTVEDIQAAQNAINDYLYKKIQECKTELAE